MLVSTTNTLDGYEITAYLGIVSGEAIMGTNIFKDFFASIRDIVGGRAAAYEQGLRKAKELALEKMPVEQRVEKCATMGTAAQPPPDLVFDIRDARVRDS